MFRFFLSLVTILIVPLALANDEERQILDIIESTRVGWEQADGTPFRAHFLDWEGARYFESGGQNVGLADLIENHVEPEGHALALELKFNNPQIHIHDDVAWVLTDTVVKATIHSTGKKIHNRGFQTTVLKKVEGRWKVLHTHSSSRAVKPTAEHNH
jgi:hypothetical protein